MNDATQQPRLIRPIPTAAIGRIVAGQAITDLASAVKELLDNAIDAGAKRVTGESPSSQFQLQSSLKLTRLMLSSLILTNRHHLHRRCRHH